jgi:redox-sensitive bicupin YhaK (pirin superfamily)
MAPRTVKAVHAAARDDINDLVTRRPIPNEALPHLDPFLFLNHHGPQTYPPKNKGLPLGPHPHRGFETVTFILDGSLAHKDSGGGESIIDAGGVQWMTAGRGLTHAELSPKKFLEKGGPLEILQLWVNLPSRWKMTPPKYEGLQKKELPSFRAPLNNSGVVVTPVSGEWLGEHGPFEPLTDVALCLVGLDDGARASFDVDAGKAVFCYVVRGDAVVAGSDVGEFNLVEVNDDGDSLDVAGRGGDTLLLLGHGTPFGEPIVSYGPFVMNSEEEIRQAIFDARSGRL